MKTLNKLSHCTVEPFLSNFARLYGVVNYCHMAWYENRDKNVLRTSYSPILGSLLRYTPPFLHLRHISSLQYTPNFAYLNLIVGVCQCLQLYTNAIVPDASFSRSAFCPSRVGSSSVQFVCSSSFMVVTSSFSVCHESSPCT